MDRSTFKIDVRNLQVDHFRTTQPGGIDQCEHDAVFEEYGTAKQLLEFRTVQDHWQLCLLFERK